MQHRVRAIWILFFLACGFTVVSFNLIQIQLVQHEKYLRMAIDKHMRAVEIAAKRGAFYDADGNILAQTQRVYDVRLDAQGLKDPEADVAKIAGALGVTVASLNFNPKDRYQLVAHEVDDGVVTKLRGLKEDDTKPNSPSVDGIITEMHEKRFYPNDGLASHVLGFTDKKGNGLAGMEKEMDVVLRGTPGERLIARDGRKKEIVAYQAKETPAIDGDDVTLTIKMGIQHVVEDQLDQIVSTYHPDAAHIIVMDPQTGEVLAMSSRPTFNPNDGQTLKPENTLNRCISDPVEPGSVFKIITLAAALNERAIDLNTQIFCENGSYYWGGRELHDDEPRGWLSAEKVLADSSNIGFAKIAINFLGEQKLYNYAYNFGIGQRTGMYTTQQGESPGVLRPVNKWSALSITRIPMGQEVSATALQMVTAMSVIANGGHLVVPHLTKQITDETGKVVKVFQPKVVRQVISSRAAHDVAEALHQVTVDGTAKATKIVDATGAGLSFAGKTGTAQKYIEKEKAYSHTQHVSSFIGFAPLEDPAFVVLVMVDNPKTKAREDYGAIVAAPVFANVAKQAAQILNIPMDIPAPPAPVLPQAQPTLTSVRSTL